MTRRVSAAAEVWPLRTAFTIARGGKTTADIVLVEIAENGVVGRGEGVPYARYGETINSVIEQVRAAEKILSSGLGRRELADSMSPGAARCAIDSALWDLEAKQEGRRAWALAGTREPTPVPTAMTVGLASVEEMGADASAKFAHPDTPIKVKLDADQILERMHAVRAAAPGARLIVDANEGWTMGVLSAVHEEMAELGVEIIEQPLPVDQDDALDGFTCAVPLCADESFHSISDIEIVRNRYQMVNIKLEKAGGLTEAQEIVEAVQQANLTFMIGCIVGTSLGIAPATLLMEDADIIDLDGPLWLERDREQGISFEGGLVHAPDRLLWG